MSAATVHSLTCYPVKGCAGVPLTDAAVSATGLAHDRTFMVVDSADGSFRSQRTLPGMAVVRAEVADDGKHLALSAPGAGELTLEVAYEGPPRNVVLFDRPLGAAVDQGEEAARWLSKALGAPSRLVRVRPGFDRDGWGEHPGKVNFADAHALSVASLASLDDLNRRIAERGGTPVPMDRFRPNIVIAGWSEPHTEDRVRLMDAGSARLGYSTRATRCSVPLVDQATGRTGGPEPVRTLAAYRREPEYGNRVSFAMKAAVLRPGVIAVGDPVEVRAWAR
ncbi:MOSC N-terminal beta barrel domain-containing protein [Streptomyces sp. ME03-5709C]|nr:MOSC N-terminal beta barrel domain-containing protein [Streptomyces sp. ME03-5709C]